MIQILKEYKIDLNALDNVNKIKILPQKPLKWFLIVQKLKNGENAIHHACRCANTIEAAKQTMAYLAKSGVPVDFQNKDGETPLHVACRFGSPDLVKVLCELTAHLDIHDDVNPTLLFSSISISNYKIDDFLAIRDSITRG